MKMREAPLTSVGRKRTLDQGVPVGYAEWGRLPVGRLPVGRFPVGRFPDENAVWATADGRSVGDVEGGFGR